MTEETVQSYWKKFLSSCQLIRHIYSKSYVAEAGEMDPRLADELGALIAEGIKTGTCSALWEWEANKEFHPYD